MSEQVRRRFVRFPVAVPVVGRAEQLAELELRGIVRVISEGGLMAEFPVQIQQGSSLSLTLQASEGPLPVEGRVVWVDPPGERIRHGVAFPDPKGYAFAIQLFLAEQPGASFRAAPETPEGFEVWLLRRVRQAEEAGEVPRSLLPDLQGELQAAGERSEDTGHAVVVRQVADLAGIDRERAEEILHMFEAQPTVDRELVRRRIAEAWLEGQRRAYQRRR